MESILKSEIFFFISTISVIVLTFILVVFGFYLIKTMKNFSEISNRLKDTVNSASSSLEEVGYNIKESPLFSFFFGKRKRKRDKR